ncbi:hypothetical protein XENOCAPTIV_006500, partial [Xenoophorus captivus]
QSESRFFSLCSHNPLWQLLLRVCGCHPDPGTQETVQFLRHPQSEAAITAVHVSIDGESLGMGRSAGGPLYVLLWEPSLYLAGLHTIRVKVEVSAASAYKDTVLMLLTHFLLHGIASGLSRPVSSAGAALHAGGQPDSHFRFCTVLHPAHRPLHPGPSTLHTHSVAECRRANRLQVPSCSPKQRTVSLYENAILSRLGWLKKDSQVLSFSFWQLLFFNIPLTSYLCWSLHHRWHGNSLRSHFVWPGRRGWTVAVHLLMLLVLTWQAHSCYFLLQTYGVTAFVLSPVRTWALGLSVVLVYRAWTGPVPLFHDNSKSNSSS